MAVLHWPWNRPLRSPVHPEGDPQECLKTESVGTHIFHQLAAPVKHVVVFVVVVTAAAVVA